MGTALIVMKKIWSFVNSKFFLAILAGLFAAYGSIITQCARQSKEEAFRWEGNYNASITKYDSAVDENGRLVVTTSQLQLTMSDIKESNDSIINKLFDQLNASRIKLNRAEHMIYERDELNHTMTARVENMNEMIQILTKDTIGGEMHKIEPIQSRVLVLDYNTPFIKEQLYLNSDKTWSRDLKVYNESFVTVYWERPGKNLFSKSWSWVKGRKRFYLDVKNTNPYLVSKPTYVGLKRK